MLLRLTGVLTLVWLFLAICLTSHSLRASPDHFSLNGSKYISLKAMANRLGMEYAWKKRARAARLSSQWTEIDFELHKRFFLLNKIKIYIGQPIVGHKGDLYLSQRDYNRALTPILTPQVLGKPSKVYHIVIDPGHGGKDPGAQRHALVEKRLTLDLALRLKRLLSRQGYRITLTRRNDHFISLAERPSLANRLKADLFLSLHFNASTNTSVHGIESFSLTPRYQPSTGYKSKPSKNARGYPGNKNDDWNTLLSFYLQQEMTRQLKAKDRGCKRARFAVLKSLECPGVLLEGGFLSNPSEGVNIRSSAYREKLALAITKGILRYQKTINRLRRASG